MKKGDKVRFLDAVGGGTVLQVDEQKRLVWVETEDGFDVGPLPMSQCVVEAGVQDYNRKGRFIGAPTVVSGVSGTKGGVSGAKGVLSEGSESVRERKAPAKRSQRQTDEWVIDLHLEALPTNGSGMTDGEKHHYQLQYFRMQMQQQLRYRGRRIVVIHGKGNGVLKNEVRNILRHEFGTKVEYHDADFSKYEEGATLVVVK